MVPLSSSRAGRAVELTLKLVGLLVASIVKERECAESECTGVTM